MKTYTRAASLLGVLLLSSALAACGNESDSASQSQPTSNNSSIEEPATASGNNDETSTDDAATDETAPANNNATENEAAEEGAADSADASTDESATDEDSAAANSDDAATEADNAASDVAIADNTPADVTKQGEQGEGADRPKTEKFEVAGTDSTDSVTGSLEEGYGYALYAMEGLEFDAKSNRLSMTANPDYYAIITPLEKGYALASLRNEGKKALEAYGTAAEVKGADVPAALSSSRLFMSAESDAGTGQFGLWETPGKGYELRINMPAGADAESFAPLVYASLSTLAD